MKTEKFAIIPSRILEMRSDRPRPTRMPRGRTLDPRNPRAPRRADEINLPALTPNSLRVYAVIADVGIDRGVRKIARPMIAERSGLTRPQVAVAIKRLRELGLIFPIETHAKLRQFDAYTLPERAKGEAWVKVPRSWIRTDPRNPDRDLSAAEFATLVYLLDHRNAGTRACRPSVPRLAELTGASVRSIGAHLKRAAELGLIVRVQGGLNYAAQTWFAHLNPKEFARATAGKPIRFSRHREDEIPDENVAPDDTVPVDAPTTDAELDERIGSHDDAPPLGDEDAPPIDGPEIGVADDLATFNGEYERVGVAA